MAPSRLHDHTGRQPGARAPGLSHSLVQLGTDTLAVWGRLRLRGDPACGEGKPRALRCRGGRHPVPTISRPTFTSVEDRVWSSTTRISGYYFEPISRSQAGLKPRGGEAGGKTDGKTISRSN